MSIQDGVSLLTNWKKAEKAEDVLCILEFKAPYADPALYQDFGRFGLQTVHRSACIVKDYPGAYLPAVGWLKSKRPANSLPCNPLSRPLELPLDQLFSPLSLKNDENINTINSINSRLRGNDNSIANHNYI